MKFAFALAAAALAAFAQDGARGEQSARWTTVWETNLLNRYFNVSNGASSADEPVVQSEIKCTRVFADTSVTALIWTSKGFDGMLKTYADEVDAGIVVRHRAGPVVVKGTAVLFFLVPAAGAHVAQFMGQVSKIYVRESSSLELFGGVDYYTTTRRAAFHGGTFPVVGLEYQRSIAPRLKAVANLQQRVDLNGAFGCRKGKAVHRSHAELVIAVAKSWTLKAPVLTYGGSYADRGRPGKITWGIGITKTF